MIDIEAVGPLASLQDLGRRGFAALGVPASGAFDRRALQVANRLVGNEAGAVAIEITLGGLILRARRAVTVAFTGAPCPGADWGRAWTLAAGSRVALGAPPTGLRSYLAVRGGVQVEPVLGSGSTDTLTGLGPPALRSGDRLRIGPAPRGAISGAEAIPSDIGRAVLDVRWGPRDDWFTPSARRRLTHAARTVRSECDRVGIRLDGPVLERAQVGELPSEPTRPGSLQVPGSGRPILFGPDAPVTGGYPVIAVLADLDHAAQLRPGDEVRFRGHG